MPAKSVVSVALLRGVNVGGNRKVPMKVLAQWLSDEGLGGVRTYIQSGNVVVEHRASLDVATAVRRAIAEHTGWDVPVIVRTADELDRVVAGNPYTGVEPTKVHVSFLAEAPSTAHVVASSAASWAPEGFEVAGRDVYLFLPAGMGRSAMVPRLTIVAAATTRNWNTVLALARMTQD